MKKLKKHIAFSVGGIIAIIIIVAITMGIILSISFDVPPVSWTLSLHEILETKTKNIENEMTRTIIIFTIILMRVIVSAVITLPLLYAPIFIGEKAAKIILPSFKFIPPKLDIGFAFPIAMGYLVAVIIIVSFTVNFAWIIGII